MRVSGKQITIRQTQAVLSILSISLVDNSGEEKVFPRDDANAEIEVRLTADTSIDSMVGVRTTKKKVKTCSECERLLCGTVKTLHHILLTAENARLRARWEIW